MTFWQIICILLGFFKTKERDVIFLKGGIEYIPAGKGPDCSRMKDVSQMMDSETYYG